MSPKDTSITEVAAKRDAEFGFAAGEAAITGVTNSKKALQILGGNVQGVAQKVAPALALGASAPTLGFAAFAAHLAYGVSAPTPIQHTEVNGSESPNHNLTASARPSKGPGWSMFS